MDHRSIYLPLLWVCTTAFALRVMGQVYVALYKPRWLPPMEEWYAGLLPYPLLLPAQLLILIAMTLGAYDYSLERGPFFITNATGGKIIVGLAGLYFAGMVVRYVVTMLRHPERRWVRIPVPIALHWVLAGYLFLWGSAFLYD